MNRGDAVADIPRTGRGDAAAGTWIFRRDESRRRRGRYVDIPRRRVAADGWDVEVRSRPAHALRYCASDRDCPGSVCDTVQYPPICAPHAADSFPPGFSRRGAGG